MSARSCKLKPRRGQTRPTHTHFGHLDALGLWDANTLFMSGWLSSVDRQILPLRVHVHGDTVATKARCFRYPRVDASDVADATGVVLLVQFPETTLGVSPVEMAQVDQVEVHLNGTWYEWLGSRGRRIDPDISTCIATVVDRLVPHQLVELERHLETESDNTSAAPETPLAQQNWARLHAVQLGLGKEAGFDTTIGPAAEPCLLIQESPIAASFESHLLVDQEQILLAGWICDPQELLLSSQLVAPEGQRAPFSIQRVDSTRDDFREECKRVLGEPGRMASEFIAVVDTRGRSFEGQTAADLLLANGVRIRFLLPPRTQDPATIDARLEVLHGHYHLRQNQEALGVLCRAQLRANRRSLDRRVKCVWQDYGPFATEPSGTLIVALGDGAPHLPHHLQCLANDPAIDDCDLVFAMNDGSAFERARQDAVAFAGLYARPFRLFHSEEAVAPARLLHEAALLARGPNLHFLSGDVFATEPGWLETILTVQRQSAAPGPIAPKILFDENTIASVGLQVIEESDQALQLEHPLRGFPAHLFEDTQTVDALDGLCLTIERNLYRTLGGLNCEYHTLAAEFADLTVRARTRGRAPLVASDASMLYVPGLEATPSEMSNVWHQRYDSWLRSQQWSTVRSAGGLV